MELSNVIIEITRQCNMACEHCLRGEPENIDIQKEYIDSFMSKVDYISNLTITGGEPSLKPKLIEYIIKSAKKHRTSINSFYIATNAKKITHEFVKSLICKFGNKIIFKITNRIFCYRYSVTQCQAAIAIINFPK